MIVGQCTGVLHRHPLTPYTGRSLQGVVERTLVRGIPVFIRGESTPAPAGQWVRRPGTARSVA